MGPFDDSLTSREALFEPRRGSQFKRDFINPYATALPGVRRIIFSMRRILVPSDNTLYFALCTEYRRARSFNRTLVRARRSSVKR